MLYFTLLNALIKNSSVQVAVKVAEFFVRGLNFSLLSAEFSFRSSGGA